MQYIWELFFREKYPQLHLIQTENYSPYYEISPLTDTIFSGDKIEYNGFCRYEKFFLNMYRKMQDDKELFCIFFDVFSRFLIECDLKSETTAADMKRRQILSEIEEGLYGTCAADLIQKLTLDEKSKLAHYVYLARIGGGTTVYLFAKAVTALLNGGTVYFDKENAGEIILYVGRKKSIHDEKLIALVEELLLPMEMKNKVLWEKHFGLIDEEMTMLIDGMMLL